jgi:hypothetical protein
MANVAFLLRLGAASTYGVERCFLDDTTATHVMTGAFAESSTQIRETASDVRAMLDAILNAAQRDIIEDGMPNTIKNQLPGLIAKHFDVAIPTLVSLIDSERIAPIISAEILKELGRLRNLAPRADLRWILEHALTLPSPYIRDGAGLGLARLADPATIPYLREIVEKELNPEVRADLQLVVDEIADTVTDDATPLADGQ